MKSIYVLLSLVLISNFAFSQEISNEHKNEIEFHKARLSKLDGYWIGEISSHNKYKPGSDLEYKDKIIILVNGYEAKVYHKDGDDFVNYGYEYGVARKATNIHIYTQDMGEGWTETISYTMTLESENKMTVVWSRVVNNFVYPLSDKQARAYFSGVSEFSPYEP